MIKLIAIGGEPATGKTSLMFELIKLADDWKLVKPQKLLDAMWSEKLRTYILGKYENDGNIFQGTDRLSMAVQPDATKFITTLAYEANTEHNDVVNIIFEGDRLFNNSFLEVCADSVKEFKILILTANQKSIDQRHVDRNDNQNEKFKNGRKTKISNIMGSLVLFDYIESIENESYEDQAKILSVIKTFFTID